jgi:hypothetical protein
MKKWTSVWIGLFAGLAFALWAIFQNPRPAFCVFLQTPYVQLCSSLSDSHNFPNESLAGLIIVVPLWFIYWACFGALIGLLMRFLVFLFRLFRGHNDAQRKSGKSN